MTPVSYKIGLADEKKYRETVEKKSAVESLISFVRAQSVAPAEIETYLKSVDSTPLTQSRKLYDVLLRNKITFRGLIEHVPSLRNFVLRNEFGEDVIEEAEIQIKYHGYIERERHIADKMTRLENISIRSEFNYNQLTSLSIESRQKLSKIRPATIGQASRIPGVSPSDINVLLVYFGR